MRRGSHPARGTAGRALAALLCALGVLAAIAAGAQASQVRTASTELRSGEAIKTLPTSKKAWQKPRVVSTLRPGSLGNFAPGDRIEAGYDIQVSVCLKNAMEEGPESNFPCPGKIYGFDPRLKTKVIIARTKTATDGLEVTPVKDSLCTQKPLRRNHHCVIQSPWKGIKIPKSGLPCKPAQCYFNVVMTAYDKEARSDGDNKVILGGIKASGKLNQGKAKFVLARFPDGKDKPQRRFRKTSRPAHSYRVEPNLADTKGQTVVLSQRLSHLHKGDQLLVDVQEVTKINHLPYDTFQRTEVILTDGRKSVKPRGKFSETTARLGAANGFNCTHGKSGHRSPCVVRKVGVLSIRKNIRKAYINVVVGGTAKGPTEWTDKWRSGDKAKVLGKRSFIHTERFKGSSSCRHCESGWMSFAPGNSPSGSKHQKLVRQLASLLIPRGQINCAQRGSHDDYICNWKASGRFGHSPKYECGSKARWNAKTKSWKIKACKEAISSNLWYQLEKRGLNLTFTGPCDELSGGRWRCRYLTEDPFCKSYGTYSRKKRSWAIDRKCH